MMLPLIRPQLEAGFGRYPGGLQLLHRLFENVRLALMHGIHLIFVVGAMLMGVAILINLMLREIPLRGHASAEAVAPPVEAV